MAQLEAAVEHWRNEAERRGAAEAALQGRLEELRAERDQARGETMELRERIARREGEAAGAQAAAQAEAEAARKIIAVLEEQLRKAHKPFWRRWWGSS